MVDLVSRAVSREALQRAFASAGLTEEQVRMVMDTVSAGDVPEGYIRHKDALEIYGLNESTLAMWVNRRQVRLHKVSHKMRFVCEADVKRRVAMMRAGAQDRVAV